MTVLVAVQQTETPDTLPSRKARLAYREGLVASTAGVAPGFVQGNLALLPATGALLVAAPLKIVGGSGSPVRVLALIERAGG